MREMREKDELRTELAHLAAEAGEILLSEGESSVSGLQHCTTAIIQARLSIRIPLTSARYDAARKADD